MREIRNPIYDVRSDHAGEITMTFRVSGSKFGPVCIVLTQHGAADFLEQLDDAVLVSEVLDGAEEETP